MQKIIPFLWFDNNAEDAVQFYVSVFSNSNILTTARYDEESARVSGIKPGTAMTISFQLEEQVFTALNGGPHFKLNPSISFYVYCESEEKINSLYKSLTDGANIMMPLGKYDWSDKYAWVEDKFGVSWQLDMDKINSPQKIVPSILFTDKKYAKVKEAITFYTSVFPESKIIFESPYSNSEDALLFAQFNLNGYLLNSMSSKLDHGFDFNEAFSFVVSCKDQDEVDHYWDKLTADGGMESQCAWLKDKYGVSWQIVPEKLMELLSDPDKQKTQKVMAAMLKMKKIIIADLEKAYQE